MKVNIEHVLSILSELSEINTAELQDIQWFKDGKHIKFDQDMIDQYKFIGLNNVGFIDYGYYLYEEKINK